MRGTGHRDADAVEIGDGEEQEEQPDHAATVARRTRHGGGLCHGYAVDSPTFYAAATAATDPNVAPSAVIASTSSTGAVRRTD